MVRPGVLLVAGAAVAAAGAWWIWRRGGLVNVVADTASAAAGAAVDLADSVIAGTVTGVGQAVGIPKTNQTECEKAKAEGRTWDASFACPASDFLRYVWS